MVFRSSAGPLAGYQPIANTETTAKHRLGTIIQASDPTYGDAEFIYLVGIGSTIVGSLVTYNPLTYVTTLSPTDTSGNGKSVAVAMSANVASQYGWYMITGMATIAKTAVKIAPSVPIFVSGTAGKIYATDSAGKQILNATTADAATKVSADTTLTVQISRPFIER